MNNEKFVAALDVGTTTIRCFIYDSNVQIRGSSCEQVNILIANNEIYIFTLCILLLTQVSFCIHIYLCEYHLHNYSI